MDNQERKILALEWVKRAEDDELNAKAILKDYSGTPAMVCFISHQIAEKCLKALLLFYSGNYPKIHSLGKLVSLINPYISSIERDFRKEVVILDPYYVETRYPDDMSLEEFTWEMAEEAFDAAKKIKEFVLSKI